VRDLRLRSLRIAPDLLLFVLTPHDTPPRPESDGEARRVFCLSNPAVFTVNEVTIGITTNDILFHLSGDEVGNAGGKKEGHGGVFA